MKREKEKKLLRNGKKKNKQGKKKENHLPCIINPRQTKEKN
jgi:hypothetical protein